MVPLFDPDRAFARAAKDAPYLTREDEFDLARRWREERDHDALHKLTHAHMRLVIAIAGRFRHYGLSANDLIQEGHVGLLEAAARFEISREVRFPPMRPGGSGPRFRITCCATGRLCGGAPPPRRRRCSSTCAACAPD